MTVKAFKGSIKTIDDENLFLFADSKTSVGTFDGSTDKIELINPKVISGDGFVDFNFSPDDMSVKRPIFGGNNSVEGLLWIHDASPYFQMYINGSAQTYGNITFILGEQYTGRWERVGDQGTLTVNGDSQTLTVDTGDITIRTIGSYTTTEFNGILYGVNLNGMLVPINEGIGVDIHNSEGFKIGNLITIDEAAFWANKI